MPLPNRPQRPNNALKLAKELHLPLIVVYDLVNWWESVHGISTLGTGKGGTVDLDGAAVT